jgi:hypothetical protein
MPNYLNFSVAALIGLMLVSCGDQSPTVSSANAQTTSSNSLLSAEEMNELFLKDALVWKFSSQPGVPFKSVGLQFVEGGKPTLISATSHPAIDGILTKVILVVQKIDKRHVLKFYSQQNGVSSLTTSESWFTKPLRTSSYNKPTSPEPIKAGTTILISGTTETSSAEKSVSYDSSNAPCRLELVIE